jgi:protein gp37
VSEKSTIEWTDATWNPVTGCTKVSPGCDHCYAERITNRFGGPGAFDTVVLHPERLTMPLHWKKPRMVFVNSMSDLFHDDVPDEFIRDVFVKMEVCTEHTFQILTKRPGRMASLLGRWKREWETAERMPTTIPRIPLPNIWLGTSVEDQKWADVRVPKLLETPAAVRFLSCEPLLGPIDFEFLGELELPADVDGAPYAGGIDWVIAGGESGPDARPMHPDWARSLRDQCIEAEIPFFFKQWGGRTAKVGGRELDGRTWDEMPPRSK